MFLGGYANFFFSGNLVITSILGGCLDALCLDGPMLIAIMCKRHYSSFICTYFVPSYLHLQKLCGCSFLCFELMARHTRPGRRLAFHRFALCLIRVFLAGGYLFSLVLFLLHFFLGIPVLVRVYWV